jgi:hypothetical protein
MGGLVLLVAPGVSAPSPLGSLLMATAGAAWGFYSVRGRGISDPVAVTGDNFARSVPMVIAVVVVVLPSIAQVRRSWEVEYWSPHPKSQDPRTWVPQSLYSTGGINSSSSGARLLPTSEIIW